MIQQQTKLCLGTMKMVPWPALLRGVSKALRPSFMNGQVSILPYSCTSTLAQIQTPPANETEKNNDSLKVQTSAADTTAPAEHLKEVAVIMKVKEVASALELCANFNSHQRFEALRNFVAIKTRPLPLIQSITEGLITSADELDMKQLSDLLFLMGKLNYMNEDILSKTCEAIKTKLDKTKTAAVVGSSIASLRYFKWKDPELLDQFSIWIERNFEKFSNPSSFILTLALQNHSPPNLEELLKLTWSEWIEMRRCSPVDTVNFVWAVQALNSQFENEKMRQIINLFLENRFLRTLDSRPQSLPVWRKLCNLHAVAKSTSGLTDTFAIPDDIKTLMSAKSQHKDQLVSEVLQLLFSDLDSNLYTRDVPSGMGFPIDILFCLDDKMKATQLHLSAGSKIAVMIHSYHECCQPTKEPSGVRSFEMRLLQEEFKVISVPYHILGGGYAQVHEYFDSVLNKLVKS
ncbi:uncharacterized protein LOC117641786 [Thrips palmi]|uniref:Uncharacterized protein LOC117641786 n=1 Tax=Thrips palmi TaxID=161013 RepID=A0A6P8YFP4_THRPL|nr:uncharacterized protein LOC117641786 [Thrips palmi]